MRHRMAMLALFVGLAYLAGVVGGRYAPGTWYAALTKPPLTPPPWVFGVVWPVLYTLIGFSAWRYWTMRGRVDGAHAWWLAQLALNASWSWVFFGLHRIAAALAVMSALIVLVALTMRAFARYSPHAMRLLIPYLAWLGFAWLLNAWFWALNP